MKNLEIVNGVLVKCLNQDITDITIPDSVTIIGHDAFSGCNSLVSVTIPDSVTIIGNGAFVDCSSLTNIKIPDSVTSIGDVAFFGCSNIQFATMPTLAIGYIPKSSLKTVVLTGGTSIGSDAFYNCRSLDEHHDPEQRDKHRQVCILRLQQPDEHHDPG